jgi:urea carboxylase
MGPTLRLERAAVIAVTGADKAPTLDGAPLEMWRSHAVKAGQTLAMGPARQGARAYLAVAGGIDVPPVLGSRSTFHMAGIGGMGGHAIKAGQTLPVGEARGTPGRRVKPSARPVLDSNRVWQIEAVPGPNDGWIDEAGHRRFLSADWTLQARSNRTGYRLTGPDWTFTERATKKRPEHGEHPSNVLDHGYPVGTINLCGQTPIILVVDAPSTGGFINPYTVPSGAFWKLAQAKPNDTFRFKPVTVDEAHALRRAIDRLCAADSLE